MPLRPLNDKVVVRPMKPASKVGSILLPDEAKEVPTKGQVLAVGPGLMDPKTGNRTPIDLRPGEWVTFSKYAGHGRQIDDPDWSPVPGEVPPKLLILGEAEIFGVVEPPTIDDE